jgi:cytochrome c oxidase assembly protein subunit 15
MSDQQTKKNNNSYKLASFGVLFAFVVIALGAFTRLVDAGLGCPDWPTCYGHLLWPESSEEIAAANNAYPEMPVIDGKAWPEMVHRYLATGLGMIAIALAVMAMCNRKEKTPVKLPLFLLGFIILQGMFGMWTVTLKLWPQVVTAHLLGGFTTLSLLWILVLRLRQQGWHLNAHQFKQLKRFKTLAVAALVVVIVQITLGGWTTSNYAAVACPDLPTCQGQWWPAMDVSEGFNVMQGIGPNYLGGTMDNDARVSIHMAHRLGAILTTLVLLMLCWRLLNRNSPQQARQMAMVIASALLLQLLLGLSNILLHFPLSVAVAHNLGGAVLLLTLITLNYQLITARSTQNK